MCWHVSALRAFELQLVQKPVVITTGRGCASPFGLKLKSRPVGAAKDEFACEHSDAFILCRRLQ